MIYDNINYFKIENNKYLFFDIFCRNNKVILICPHYSDYEINYDNIIIKYNNIDIELCENIKNVENKEKIIIKIFKFNKKIENDSLINLTVFYNNLSNNYTIIYKEFIKKFDLVHTTLFKKDYYLIDIFYKYYIKQGVDHFYLYYNDILTEKIISLCSIKNKITLIEWNFPYWNYTNEHLAQPLQINHAFYKYGIVLSNYMTFNDLDEYMYSNEFKLIDLVKSNKYELYIFQNYWCSTIDNEIPEEFPNKFKKNKEGSEINFRTKVIYNTNYFKLLGIHGPLSKFDGTIIKENVNFTVEDLFLFHFQNWSNVDRKNELIDYEIFSITDNK